MGDVKITDTVPVWWNGRHGGLKILWGLLRTGSSPVTGTKKAHPFRMSFFSAAPTAQFIRFAQFSAFLDTVLSLW